MLAYFSLWQRRYRESFLPRVSFVPQDYIAGFLLGMNFLGVISSKVLNDSLINPDGFDRNYFEVLPLIIFGVSDAN